MSIPGLGHIPDDTPVTTNRIIKLSPFWEWRFEIGFTSQVTVKLVNGTAEKDGTELAQKQPYRFTGLKSKIFTWTGCELEIDGVCLDEFVEEYAAAVDTPMNAYMNLHYKLTSLRANARREGAKGPRIMIVGPPNSGKTTLVRTLTAYATRCEEQPLVVNLDPKDSMLSVPGTLSCSVFAGVMDIESPDGWGSSPSSGSSVVPVKVPAVFYYGHSQPDQDPATYRSLVSNMAGMVTTRLSEDSDVRGAGLLIDTPGVNGQDRAGIDCLAHIAEEFSVNIIVVLDSSQRLYSELSKRFKNTTSSLGDSITTILLDKSSGVAERNESWVSQSHQAAIKHYFFGDSNQTLSPFTQQVDVSGLTLFQIPERKPQAPSPKPQSFDDCFDRTHSNQRLLDTYVTTGHSPLVPTQLTTALEQWTLTIMNASSRDLPEAIRVSTVKGFVYVAQVDSDRGKAKILAPVAGQLGDHPMIWGKWPEPNVNLLG
ncbi:mRNA cleavage and polyadenylation factor clp1 [Ceratocystis lukuohia]|uniref:Polynucleotide 5'-hydroxyl-kinase GRC3 n=1 Tax=Ceratocystis lukuohia TaxID=2019550 RepID=A0ABR4MFR8_9PEZI